MRIGDAAAAAWTTPRALRFYEERGLLPPPRRTAGGQREYGPDEVARVRVIRELLALGLTVEDLRPVADRIGALVENPQRQCGQPDSDVPGSGVVDRRFAASTQRSTAWR
ncbi:MerR family transcriptional regulator [Streptomyces violascens]|uniref:MerR family transcriptional regulator n=1 Tax=Streptomyces violascens TaxID=67381 RepID=UPI00365EFC5A